jgi:OOP family OmpA-OmpF porin
MKTKLLPLAAVLSLLTFGAQAQTLEIDSADIQNNDQGAYAVDGDGDVVRDSWNRCVRTNYWTPETAINKCEGIAEPKPVIVVVVVPEPVAVVAPVIVETIVDDVPAAFRGFFDLNKTDLKPAASEKLDTYADYMTRNSAKNITVTGHTDATGDEAYNLSLSEKRANSVKSYLTDKGIDGKRIQTSGMGESAPISTNKTKEGRAENRRVEITVIK